jgi:transcriptional regulator with XRE-family HTH domain
MNLKERIAHMIKERNLDIKRDLLPKIEMTEQGYHAMFRNDSIKVSTLIKIAECLNVPISAFFDEKNKRNSFAFEFSFSDVLNIDLKERKIIINKKIADN